MRIGKVIRKYRKEIPMTQEEMAARLGVTASAVNKWENGVSLPDILLLAPIARLLGVTVDTLLAFREEPAPEEIRFWIREADEWLQTGSYEEAFCRAKKRIEEYPNCDELRLSLAVILDAGCVMREDLDAGTYEEYLESCYVRSLACKDAGIRLRAAESLFCFYLRKEAYEKAEECLTYFSDQNPEKKSRRADLYQKTGRREEAYREYEELLFSELQRMRGILAKLSLLAKEDGETERIRFLAEKQKELARVFEMGKYYEAVDGLEAAVMEKDADACLTIVRDIWEGILTVGDDTDSFLYEHMKFRKVSGEFAAGFRRRMMKSLKEDPAFDFLRGDVRWQELVEHLEEETA
ncbi:MAG: helix-turn-helix transcriptional regulator [Lachnospiraceae bacterium]|nr:helix-turn-helix transcriptional regulator [Lachnospiraceae bacterium]